MQNTDPSKPNYVARTPDAVEAARVPQQGVRSQDADADANDGKTITLEGGSPVDPEQGTQPEQPNPSSLRQ